jgi:beta-lactamase regulating signal transducer with metallopeptidase domain
MTGPSFAGWAVEALAATTLLMLLVMALRKPVSRFFGPGVAYGLWLLPVLRLFLPPLPESWLSAAEAPVSAASEVMTYYIVDAQPAGNIPVASAATFDWLLLLLFVWAAGALAFLAYHLIAHRRFCNNLLRRANMTRTVAEGRVHVIETDGATGPLAFGIWRKYVAFPRDFGARYDPLERNLALAHELGHHLRGDLIANWVALTMLALHWFNPVAWRAFRAFRADQEMACDALVLAGRAPALRHAYGRAIVKSAHGGAVSAACHLHTINELKGRLRMLAKHDHKSRRRIAAGITGAAALSLGALALTASGTQAATALRADMGAAIGVDLSQSAAPTPPDAPAPPSAPSAPPAPDAKKAHKIRIVTQDKDGKITVHDSGDGDAPHIVRQHIVIKDGEVTSRDGKDGAAHIFTSAKCGAPRDGEIKLETKDGDRRRIIICTDRIEARADAARDGAEKVRVIALARAGEAQALALARADLGKRHAMIGLQMARKSIEAQSDLSPTQKAAALKGIDDAIRELDQADKD